MGTNAEREAPEPDAREQTIRSVIAGHPQGAVRRIVLYVLAFALIVSPWPMAAVVPLALLALTDVLA